MSDQDSVAVYKNTREGNMLKDTRMQTARPTAGSPAEPSACFFRQMSNRKDKKGEGGGGRGERKKSDLSKLKADTQDRF